MKDTLKKRQTKGREFFKINMTDSIWDIIPNLCPILKNYDHHFSWKFTETILFNYRGYEIGFYKGNFCLISFAELEKYISIETIRQFATELEEKGYVIRDDDGRYTFVPKIVNDDGKLK